MSRTKDLIFRVLAPVRDMNGERWDVVLKLGAELGPVLSFVQCEGKVHRRADYYLSTVMETIVQGEPFIFGGPGCSETPRRIGAPAVVQLVAEAAAAIPATVGEFEVRWRPFDPEAPF